MLLVVVTLLLVTVYGAISYCLACVAYNALRAAQNKNRQREENEKNAQKEREHKKRISARDWAECVAIATLGE